MPESHGKVLRYLQRELTTEQARQIADLEFRSMEGSTKTLEDRLHFILASAESDDSEQRDSVRYVIWDNDSCIAHARTFTRTIYADESPLEILALATVCSDPARRGEGLGRIIVEAAFAPVDSGMCEFSIFQTGVPDFYRKLNCRLIDNRIVNKKADSDASPFEQNDVMIYPADRDWPLGTVDLNGDGY